MININIRDLIQHQRELNTKNITNEAIVSPTCYSSKEDWEIYNKKVEEVFKKEATQLESLSANKVDNAESV